MKLKYKYNSRELYVGVDRVLRWSERCIRGQKYSLEYITATLNIDEKMAKDILSWMSEAGFIDKSGEYYTQE